MVQTRKNKTKKQQSQKNQNSQGLIFKTKSFHEIKINSQTGEGIFILILIDYFFSFDKLFDRYYKLFN